MVPQGGDDFRRRRKPRIQDVGIDDDPAAFESIESGSDSIEKGSTMKTSGGFAEWEIELPDGFTFQAVDEPAEVLHPLAQRRNGDLQKIVSDRTRANAPFERLQAA